MRLNRERCILLGLLACTVCAWCADTPAGDATVQYQFDRLWPQLQQPWYFFRPGGVALDADNNLYVADTSNSRIRKFTSDGQYITQIGQLGTEAGAFDFPRGLAIGPDISGEDRLFVADTNNSRIQVLDLSGRPIRQFATRANGTGALFPPTGVAVDDLGSIYITAGDNLRVQKISLLGTVTEYVGDGTADPSIESCVPDLIPCGWPPGIAVDNNGHVFVADPVNFRVIRLSDTLQFQLAFGEQGQPAGITGGRFFTAFGLDVAPDGDVVVTDSFNGRVQRFSNDGAFIGLFGESGGEPGQLGNIEDVAVDTVGNVYVADTSSDRVQKFTPEGRFINQIGSGGNRTGAFAFPADVTVDGAGNVYVADTDNYRVQRFQPNGRFATAWGAEGRGAPGLFVRPQGIAVHPVTGRIYVADTDSSNSGTPPRFQIFEQDGRFVAEREIPDVMGLPGVRDETVFPTGMAIDNDGNIFVVETSFVNFIDPEADNTPVRHRIQRFDPDGGVLTFGRFGEGDGQLDGPQDIAVGGDGNVYVADTFNHRIQKFTNFGGFVRAWGGFGDHAGEFNEPSGVTVGPDGLIYVADTMNNRIQVFTAAGGFVQILGQAGDGPGQFLQPGGLDFGPDGAIYVADSRHNRIQRFRAAGDEPLNKAIIVASGGDVTDNPLWPATQMLANLAYRTLEHQGFTKDTIRYLSADTGIDLDSNGAADDILPLTGAQVRATLTTWAADADNVLVYMTGLGRRDNFRLNAAEAMTDTELDGELDTLQGQIGGFLYVIYDASQSGSFIDALAGNGGQRRRVIASAAADEPAFFVTGGTLSFSYPMLQDMFNGMSVGQAVLDARTIVGTTLDYQTPQIDTNGNGIANQSGDTLTTDYLFLRGVDSFDGPPTAAEVSPDMTIGENETEAPFFAHGVADDVGNVVRAWCIVTWPTTLKGASNVVTARQTFELQDQGNGDFEGTYGNLMPAGEYVIDVYAMDSNMNAAPVDQVVVVKAGAILAGNIACLVRDAGTQDPILDASVARDPGNVSITFNVDGVYFFTGLPDGEYTITASAAGYLPETQTVELAGGAIMDATFDLVRDGGEGEGEGEGEGKPEGTFVLCSAPMPGEKGFNGSDVLLGLGLVLALLWRRGRRSGLADG